MATVTVQATLAHEEKNLEPLRTLWAEFIHATGKLGYALSYSTVFEGQLGKAEGIHLVGTTTEAKIENNVIHPVAPEPVEEPEEVDTDELRDALTVAFASNAARDLAFDEGLADEDFEGVKPSGKTGYTKADVEGIIG